MSQTLRVCGAFWTAWFNFVADSHPGRGWAWPGALLKPPWAFKPTLGWVQVPAWGEALLSSQNPQTGAFGQVGMSLWRWKSLSKLPFHCCFQEPPTPKASRAGGKSRWDFMGIKDPWEFLGPQMPEESPWCPWDGEGLAREQLASFPWVNPGSHRALLCFGTCPQQLQAWNNLYLAQTPLLPPPFGQMTTQAVNSPRISPCCHLIQASPARFIFG